MKQPVPNQRSEYKNQSIPHDTNNAKKEQEHLRTFETPPERNKARARKLRPSLPVTFHRWDPVSCRSTSPHHQWAQDMDATEK